MFVNYDEALKEVKEKLAGVDHFFLKFNAPTRIGHLQHIKPGSKRRCNKQGRITFVIANSKLLVTPRTVAHLLSMGEAELILPGEE